MNNIHFDTEVVPDPLCGDPLKQAPLPAVFLCSSVCLDSDTPQLFPSEGIPHPGSATLCRPLLWVDTLLTLVSSFFLEVDFMVILGSLYHRYFYIGFRGELVLFLN